MTARAEGRLKRSGFMGQSQLWLPRQMGARVGREQWIDVFIKTSFWLNPPISIFFFPPRGLTPMYVMASLSSSKRCFYVVPIDQSIALILHLLHRQPLHNYQRLKALFRSKWHLTRMIKPAISCWWLCFLVLFEIKVQNKIQFLTRWTWDARITLNRQGT